DITASSQFGVNGTVEINNLSIDPSSGLVELDVELSDESQQIASGCSSNADSSFVSTGRGGVPQNPNEQLDSNPSWSDIRDLSAYRKQNNNTVERIQISNKPAIVEATGFILNSKGEIELVAIKNKPSLTNIKTDCSGYST
ncbi:MAG: filamentous hemagglutinin, partial [Cyanobacteriota bacterium]|nr:filamentous hemagglutinin [Cyanobacteriota bacterium]